MQACGRSSRQFNGLLRGCSCSTAHIPPRKRQRTGRYVSTSTTAINGTRPIPLQNRALYDALKEVESKGANHVNRSRLRLALQGLESDRPTTRVALLGLNGQDVARQIARLLLADALEDESVWEKQILQQHSSNGVLIRHGQPQNSNIPPRSTLPTLHIPSPVLERLNIELLVAAVNGENEKTSNVPAETFLAPAVGVPTAFDGRQVTVNQPVHQALFIAQGLDELVSAIQLLADTEFHSREDTEAVVLVANLPASNTPSQKRVLVSDVARADKGLRAIRQSVAQATIYEHEWLASGMPQLSQWLHAATSNGQPANIPPPAVQKLISAVLTTASSSIESSIANMERGMRSRELDSATRMRTESAIDDFSRAAHQELQSGLASAWSSRNWRKLSWYKLFWRVDDVGFIVSDLITNSWLPKTERAVYEISGRLTQLGINPVMAQSEAPLMEHKSAFEPVTTRPTLLDPASPVLATATTAPANEVMLAHPPQAAITSDPGQDRPTVEMRPPPLPVPIASTISHARNTYLNQQITSLTTTAQQLVFRTLSISGLSGGLSALTYVSTIAPTLYEASSIFAVGTVFALYRMQTGWQNATKSLERGLFEEGRDVIKQVVGRISDLVAMKASEQALGDPVERQMLEDAQKAVETAKTALQELNSTSPLESEKRP